jgi:hypothetical protein
VTTMACEPARDVSPAGRTETRGATVARGRTNAFWLVPTVTFLVGLILGGVLVGVSNLGRDDDAPSAAAPVPTPTPGGSSQDVTVVVPRSCVEAAERSEQVLALTREAAEALGELDARRLADVVDEMRTLQTVVGGAAASCRDAAAAANATTGAAPTPAFPAPTPAPGSPTGQEPAGVIRPSPSTG